MRDANYIRTLVEQLNDATKAYDEGKPYISDAEWDEKYYELVKLEKETGIYYPNSPTQSIDYQVVSGLSKTTHKVPMLSLDKTKSIDDIKKFIDGKEVIASLKMDGLSCRLEYIDGNLVSASTRGNGTIGENITHNAMVLKNVPQSITYKEPLIIDGEVICDYKSFEPFSADYKHPRNFAAGAIRLLNSKESAARNLSFVVWEVIEGFDNCETLSAKLEEVEELGFDVVPHHIIHSDFKDVNNDFQTLIIDSLCFVGSNYPIDGLVFKYDNCAYFQSLGTTGHHPRGAYAMKFYDETYETTLLDIEWQLSRTGQINPVAVFDEVEIDGTSVSKASLSNLTILHNTLNMPWRGQSITVSKRNLIIPKVESADVVTIPEDDKMYISMPAHCPVCGGAVIVRKDNDSEILFCNNPNCEGKFLTSLNHFCSKNGLDIKGLSAATLEKLIDWGWVERYGDIFTLSAHRDEWIKKPGFGTASVDKVLAAIEKASHCNLANYISAFGIPLVGLNTAKELCTYFPTWKDFINAIETSYPFYQLSGFGREINNSLSNFDYSEARYIAHNFVSFIEPKAKGNESAISGKTFVITGSLEHYKNRDELKAFIESSGGKVAGSVSGKTNYLINNDPLGRSSKNLKAQSLNIPIITEDEFLNLF